MDNVKVTIALFCCILKQISRLVNTNSVKKTLTYEKTQENVPRFRIKVVILHPKENNN